MSHIFISYSRANQEYARQLVDFLLDQGFDVWIDDRIDYGEKWWRVVIQAVRDSVAFVVIMTPESEQSAWVEREYLLADRLQKPVFPILLDGECWPFYLNAQYVDVRAGGMPPQEYCDELAEVIPPQETRGIKVLSGSSPGQSPGRSRVMFAGGAVFLLVLVLIGVLFASGVFESDKLSPAEETEIAANAAIYQIMTQNAFTKEAEDFATAVQYATEFAEGTATAQVFLDDWPTLIGEVTLSASEVTNSPTNMVTYAPTDMPTSEPSATPTPALRPSDMPTPGPTSIPSLTLKPTRGPLPTYTPTSTRTPSATPTPTNTKSPLPVSTDGDPSNTVDWLFRSGFISDNNGYLASDADQYNIDLTGQDNTIEFYNFAGVNSYSDFVLAADIVWGEGADEDDCGFIFRKVNTGNFYLLNINRSGEIQFFPRVNSEWETVQEGGTLQRSSNRQVLLAASGEMFVLFVDGVEVTRFQDAALDWGSVAISMNTYDESDQTSCTFNDLWVWEVGVEPQTVSVDAGINVRGGPSSSFEILGNAGSSPYQAIGRNADSSWLQILFDEQPGWVRYDLTNGVSDFSALPVRYLP